MSVKNDSLEWYNVMSPKYVVFPSPLVGSCKLGCVSLLMAGSATDELISSNFGALDDNI